MYVLTVSPEEAPDQPEYVEVEFEKGDAVAVNGERLSPSKLLAKLNELGGKHGIGRVDLMENRYVGMKSRGVYETPAGRSSKKRTARSSRSPWTAKSCTCAIPWCRATRK